MKLTQTFGSEQLLHIADANMNITLFMKLTFIFWYEGMVKHYKFFSGENAVKELLDALKRAFSKGVEAVGATYIEADKQLEVIGFTEVGRLEPLSHKTWITRQVERARQLATTGATTIQVVAPSWKKSVEMPIKQVISDPDISVVKVRYSPGGEAKYTFKTSVPHKEGDFVGVEKCDGSNIIIKNVQIGWVGTMKNSEIAAIEKKYSTRVAKIKYEHPVPEELAWREWGGHDPREAAPVNLLSDEEIAEAQAFIDSLHLVK